MSLTYFPVSLTLRAVVSDSSKDVDGDPDFQNISSTVTFVPSVAQVFSAVDTTIYELRPIVARTGTDGVLRTIDDHTVSLVANSSALGLEALYYDVAFTNAVFDRETRNIDGFRFQAPTSATPVDLATVERVTK